MVHVYTKMLDEILPWHVASWLIKSYLLKSDGSLSKIDFGDPWCLQIADLAMHT